MHVHGAGVGKKGVYSFYFHVRNCKKHNKHTHTHMQPHAHTHTHTHMHTYAHTEEGQVGRRITSTMKEVCLDSRLERMNSLSAWCSWAAHSIVKKSYISGGWLDSPWSGVYLTVWKYEGKGFRKSGFKKGVVSHQGGLSSGVPLYLSCISM